MLPPGHPLAGLFLILTTLANAGEPGGGAAEAGAGATCGGCGGGQAAPEAGSAGRSAPGLRRDGRSAGSPGGGGTGGGGAGRAAVGALRPGWAPLAAAEAPRRPEAAPGPGIRSPQRVLGSPGDAAGGCGRRGRALGRAAQPSRGPLSRSDRRVCAPLAPSPGFRAASFSFPFARESCWATPDREALSDSVQCAFDRYPTST